MDKGQKDAWHWSLLYPHPTFTDALGLLKRFLKNPMEQFVLNIPLARIVSSTTLSAKYAG